VQSFTAPIWITYRQAVQLGAHVRKGEKGSPVVYANSITRHETDTDSGVDVARDIHFLKGYTVFNVEQIDGLPPQYSAPASPRLDVSARIARAERFFGATGATLAYGGNRAFYRPSTDSIVLPLFETFRDAESYYATLAHETTHWTAHESRLARDFGTKCFGSGGYAIEELVAELGAAFLCADLDLTLEDIGRMIINKVPDPKNGGPSVDVFGEVERVIVGAALSRTKGNKQAAANLLGVYRPRLYSMIKKHNLLSDS